MKLLLLIVVAIALLGPLRPWLGRHWAFLVSVAGGAAIGFIWAAFVLSKVGYSEPLIPLLSAVIVAIAAGRHGPRVLRQIQRDGRDGNTP